jgi:hypothetical protein
MRFGCVTVGLGERLRPEKNTDTVDLVNARIAENQISENTAIWKE